MPAHGRQHVVLEDLQVGLVAVAAAAAADCPAPPWCRPCRSARSRPRRRRLRRLPPSSSPCPGSGWFWLRWPPWFCVGCPGSGCPGCDRPGSGPALVRGCRCGSAVLGRRSCSVGLARRPRRCWSRLLGDAPARSALAVRPSAALPPCALADRLAGRRPLLWPPPWAALIASTSSAFFIPVALMPRPPATCLSSGSSMLLSPPASRRWCSGGGASVVSVMLGSFPRQVGSVRRPASRLVHADAERAGTSRDLRSGESRWISGAFSLDAAYDSSTGRLRVRRDNPDSGCDRRRPPSAVGSSRPPGTGRPGPRRRRSQHQDRRSGAGDERRPCPSRAQRLDQRSESGIAGSR